MLNDNKKNDIKRLIRTAKKGLNLGLPSYSDGEDGDLRIYLTKIGPSLYGKARNRWYRFGFGDEVGYRGRTKKKAIVKAKKIAQKLNVVKEMSIGKAKFTIENIDHLSINSGVFDIDSSGSNSTLHIGDINIQPSWGSDGGIIQVVGADNNSGRHLTISGGDSTGGSSNGGNVYMDAGGSGGGTQGTISIGHNGSNVISSATNLYSNGDIALSADGGNVTMDDGTNTIFNFNVDAPALRIADDANTADYFQIGVGAEGATTISTVDDGGAVGHLTLAPDGDFIVDTPGDITLDVDGAEVFIKDGGTLFAKFMNFVNSGSLFLYSAADNADYLLISCGNNGLTSFTTTQDGTDNTAHMTFTADGNIVFSAEEDLIFNSQTGVYAAKVAGTEFSAADSAYAGMILGYTIFGANRTDTSYTLTTSYVCFQNAGSAEISVSFKTPPSEFVELEVELYFSSGSGASDLFLSISDNATYGSNSLTNDAQFEKVVITPSRGWGGTITQKFFLQADNLASIGSANAIYIAAKTDSTSGTPIIRWGGNASGEYTNIVMKATALPATIDME